ncbi:3-oxoacyl-[acyl-carrier-protein] reductase FabG [Caulifigura coniformis]|uniref:3-oxoacyl-[acyl-carrier-protein] reductase FabG n=2 Tax=Caulifigura coniformis TaxID=2527983 RepID=A0A517SLF6_9PLAN|nr:3-oxoacyl-[acyl-carrier-protein] reductase FabG [Caulifigura coniformis]
MSRALAEAGASVVVTSRRLAEAERIASELPQDRAARHLGVELDHMSEASIADGFANAISRAGQIDVLVANGHEGLSRNWTEVTGEEFTRQLQNAAGYFLLARHLRNHVVARGADGTVILVGSMYGVVGSYPSVYDGLTIVSPAAYHALKGGIVHLTRHLAVLWAKDRVRVNCLSPGAFPPERVSPELRDRLAARAPMGRLGNPDELKGPILFLASAASSYMTGQNLLIDGGWTAW